MLLLHLAFNTWLILVSALEMIEAGSKHCGLEASTGPTRGDSQSAMLQASFDHFQGENKDEPSVDGDDDDDDDGI